GARGASAAGCAATLTKGALNMAFWTNTKVAVAAGVAVLLGAGAAVPVGVMWERRSDPVVAGAAAGPGGGGGGVGVATQQAGWGGRGWSHIWRGVMWCK